MQKLFAFLLILGVLPVFILLSILLLVFDGTPILFYQTRIGLHKHPFVIYKFRTMSNGEVTRIGKIYRRTGMDEIPQLFNILKGEMNFVGPRPLTQTDIERLGWNSNEFTTRWNVKPGITGLAQLSSICDASHTIANDTYYVNHKSIGLDIKIIFQSLLIPIIGKKRTKKLLKEAS